MAVLMRSTTPPTSFLDAPNGDDGPDPRSEGQELSPEADPDGQPRLGVVVSSSEVTPVRRRRRRLNGEVTIIRPPSQAVGDERTRANSQAQSSDLGRFGVDLEAQRRHEKLLARIALLQRQAQKVQNTEAAAAVRWIKKAINEYGIEASVLGFQSQEPHSA